MTEEEEEDERKVENSAVFCWTRNRNLFLIKMIILAKAEKLRLPFDEKQRPRKVDTG